MSEPSGHAAAVPDHLRDGESLRADVAAWCARMLAGPWRVRLERDSAGTVVVLHFDLAADFVAFLLRWR